MIETTFKDKKPVIWVMQVDVFSPASASAIDFGFRVCVTWAQCFFQHMDETEDVSKEDSKRFLIIVIVHGIILVGGVTAFMIDSMRPNDTATKTTRVDDLL